MKIISLLALISCLSLNSCGYSDTQKKMIQQIAASKNVRYENTFRTTLLKEFSKKDLVHLSSHENPKVALYFFNILVEKYPEECFGVLMKNLDNKKTILVFTSYDTINELTVPDAMMYYTIRKKSLFTQQQKAELFGSILNDFEHKYHLEGYLFLYLHENEKHPDPEYYQPLRKLMQQKRNNTYYGNSVLLNYTSNYNKPEDSLLIKDFLYKNVNENSSAPIHMNAAVEFIKKHPKRSYLPILEEFYHNKVKGKSFHANDSFFKLEDLTIATLHYKTEKAKELMKNIAYHTAYEPNDNSLAINEHLYFLLTKYDTSNYFSEITDVISPKISKIKIDSVTSKHERWDQYIH